MEYAAGDRNRLGDLLVPRHGAGGAVFAIDTVGRYVAVGRKFELRAGQSGGRRKLVVVGIEEHRGQGGVFEMRIDE
jgi:hypothetical protein